jgi:hypothetical protein
VTHVTCELTLSLMPAPDWRPLRSATALLPPRPGWRSLRGSTGHGYCQLPQPDRRAVPQQRKQSLEELVGERFLHRDRGHDRVRQQPGLIVAIRTPRLPRQPQRNRTCPLGHPGSQPQPQRPVRSRVFPPPRRRRTAQHRGDVGEPVIRIPASPAAPSAYRAPDEQLRPATPPTSPRSWPRHRGHTSGAAHWSLRYRAPRKYRGVYEASQIGRNTNLPTSPITLRR